MSKLILLPLAFLLLVLPPLAATAKTYVAGIEPSFPPWASVQDGQYVGIAPDAVRAIAKIEGFDVKFVSMAFPSLIPAVKAGKIDILVTGLTVTPKRAKQIDYTIPWWQSKVAVLVSTDSSINIGTALCCGSKVGAQTGSTEYEWVKNNLVANKTGAEVRAYAQDTTALQDLKIGRLQATVVDADTSQAFVAHNAGSVRVAGIIQPYPPQSYALAIKKGDPDGLLAKLNEGIMKIYKSGQWADIIHKYMPGVAVMKIPTYMSKGVDTYKKPIPGLSQ